MLIVLLASIVNASTHAKCVFSSDQKFEIQPTFINLHPNEYNQEWDYYTFGVKLDKCAGSCNTLNDLSNRIFVPIKQIKQKVFKYTCFYRKTIFIMITGKKESKFLTKMYHANVNTDLMENIIQINGGIMKMSMWV